MNELKPVALFGGTANNNSEVWGRRLNDWPLPARDTELYAIPHAHRVVSVEFLQLLRSLSVANGHENTARQLRAIIDNKEQS